MPNFSMKMEGGNVKTGSSLRALVDQKMKLESAADNAIRILRSFTPVRSGNLRGRWVKAPGGQRWSGNRVSLDVINTANYALRVNQRGRSAGYADRGIEAAQNAVMSELKASGASIAANLWDKAGGRGRPD